MGRKRHPAEEIVNKLRQAEVELGKGKSAGTGSRVEWRVGGQENKRVYAEIGETSAVRVRTGD